jgi:hypothetical protein
VSNAQQTLQLVDLFCIAAKLAAGKKFQRPANVAPDPFEIEIRQI